MAEYTIHVLTLKIPDQIRGYLGLDTYLNKNFGIRVSGDLLHDVFLWEKGRIPLGYLREVGSGYAVIELSDTGYSLIKTYKPDFIKLVVKTGKESVSTSSYKTHIVA